MQLFTFLFQYGKAKMNAIEDKLYFTNDALNGKHAQFVFQPKRLCFATHISKVLAFIIDACVLSAVLVWFNVNGLVWFLCALIYFCAFESSPLQGSIGERLAGLRVFHNKGKKLHWKHVFVRNLTYFFTGGLSSLSSLLSRKHSSLHDQLAHTIVFREKTAPKL